MTITLPIEHRLLTVEEFDAIDEDEHLRRLELLEGNLVMPPEATPRHMVASGTLFRQLGDQVPVDLIVIYESGVDLQLALPDQPGTVRRPDLIVVTRAELDRVNREGGRLRASGVVLAVEIISPGSRRTDTIMKRRDYADAGIPHYWIVDLEPQPSLIACELVDGEYRDAGPVTGTFEAEQPFPVRLDLGALT